MIFLWIFASILAILIVMFFIIEWLYVANKQEAQVQAYKATEETKSQYAANEVTKFLYSYLKYIITHQVNTNITHYRPYELFELYCFISDKVLMASYCIAYEYDVKMNLDNEDVAFSVLSKFILKYPNQFYSWNKNDECENLILSLIFEDFEEKKKVIKNFNKSNSIKDNEEIVVED